MTENRQAPEADRRGQAEEADRLAKQREYNRRWRANHPESSEQRDHRLAKRREYSRVAYRARRDAQTVTERNEEQQKVRLASRAFRARMSPEEHMLVIAKQRARYANVEERRERDSRSLKPYPKSYRDKVIANYALKGLTVSRRMLDELDGNRDPQTPPLFRRA